MGPSDTAWQQLISALHASGRKAALAITGGGSGAIGELLRVPGGSRLLIEAQVPYDAQALATYLGFAPEQASSADTAIAMARSARARAARLVPAGTDLVGLGATAALVSDRPRRGEHRFHIAAATSAGIEHCTCVMAKGRRDRGAEEDLVSRAIVLWLAHACGVAAPSPRTLLDADEQLEETVVTIVDPIDQLVAGDVDRVTVQPDGQMMLSAPRPAILLPGSFNPLHTGHVLLARVAEELRQLPLAFEISVTNVDKPPLSAEAVRQPAPAIRREIAGRTHESAHLPREVALVSRDHVRDRGGYGGAAGRAEILWRRRDSNAPRARGNREVRQQLYGGRAPRLRGTHTLAERHRRAAAVRRSLQRNPGASVPPRHLLIRDQSADRVARTRVRGNAGGGELRPSILPLTRL